MITKANDAPCWVVPFHDDEMHFPTELGAIEFVKQYGSRYGEPHQLPVPCWTAVCDTESCDGIEGTEDGDLAHIPALNAHHAALDLQELVEVDGDLLCTECLAAASPPPDQSEPPAIVSYDDVARMIATLTALYTRCTHPADASTHAFVTRLTAMTRRVPAGRDGWSVSVSPFVLQPPLVDMPTTSTEVSR